jgi:hypothetical protein
MGIFLKNVLSEPLVAPMLCKYCPFSSFFLFVFLLLFRLSK